MILVLIFSVGMLLLALVASRVALSLIRPSDASEQSFAALAAAEAGIDDYRAHLQARPDYYVQIDPSNPSLVGWADVPGGETTAQYRVAVDASRAGAGGEIHVFSTGRSGNVTRTVEAVLSKRSTLDYVYLSDIETPSPRLPGAYSSAVVSGTSPALTGKQLAELLCSRYWYQSGQVSLTGTGNQRNLKFCQWAGIYGSERLAGKVHTNDVWRLDNSSLASALDLGAITSSCRSTAEGLLPGEVGCPELRRFIATNDSGLYSNNGNNATWTTSTTYQGDSWRMPSTGDLTQRNPAYAEVLELPQSSSQLKTEASATGCVYTGPTRIRFAVESGQGFMYVTSPDTKVTAPACGGTSLAGNPSTPGSQPTQRIALGGFSDLVIYVQDVPRPGGVDSPDNAYDTNNAWSANSEPTCQLKGTKKYPYVIPSSTDAVDRSLFNTPSGWAYKGFPSEFADPSSPWYGSSCSNGDLYLQGTFKGRMTIATQSNIVLTSSITANGSNATTGQPATTSQEILGLVSEKFTYLYRPFTSGGTWVGDWRTSNAQNPKINAAILAVDECFATQDPYTGSRQGDIYLWGSLAQKFRCVVGSTGGYNKQYSFDTRFNRFQPPYMLELSTEPWEVQRYLELNPSPQAIGTTVSYSLVNPEDSGATVRAVTLETANASILAGGTAVTVTPNAEGPVIISYEVVLPTRVDQRRLVIQAE